MAANALVIGEFADRERDELAHAMQRASVTPVFCNSVQRGLQRMRPGQELPMCVVVDGELNVRQLVDGIRDGAESFALPVMVLLAQPTNAQYRDAYLAGADDVLTQLDWPGITRRLVNLASHRVDFRPAATLGRAMVASRNGASRRRLGRTLRQVGFDVAYASDLDEVAKIPAGEDSPAFVVSTEAANPALAIDRSGGSGKVGHMGKVPVLFLDDNDDETQTGDQVADITGRLLFFADEQAKAKFKDRRASARMLYSTICWFREAGLQMPLVGVTHNVSREGLYIRTFDPIKPASMIWLELCPPRSETAVVLRARVMWQRLPGSGQGVLPPGFGLQIDAAQCPALDLRDFIAGYQTLAE